MQTSYIPHCSHVSPQSLIFDPDDQKLPILKYPFAKVEALEKDPRNEEGCVLRTAYLVRSAKYIPLVTGASSGVCQLFLSKVSKFVSTLAA